MPAVLMHVRPVVLACAPLFGLKALLAGLLGVQEVPGALCADLCCMCLMAVCWLAQCARLTDEQRASPGFPKTQQVDLSIADKHALRR